MVAEKGKRDNLINVLNLIKDDIQILLNNYTKENTCYSEHEITYIRFGIVKTLKVIEKYIKLQGE